MTKKKSEEVSDKDLENVAGGVTKNTPGKQIHGLNIISSDDDHTTTSYTDSSGNKKTFNGIPPKNEVFGDKK